jgi:serine/threonine-protein kinase
VFAARGSQGKEQLATRLLNQTGYTLLPGTENASDPFFSPDGEWIGFFADSKMKKIPVDGGLAVTLVDGVGNRGASWSDGGDIIAQLAPNAVIGLFRVPAIGIPRGINPDVLTRPVQKGEVNHRWPQVLPGGNAVLFTTSTVSGQYEQGLIDVLLLKTGQWKTVQRGGYFGRYVPSGHLIYISQGTLFAVPFDLDRLEVRGTPVPLFDDVAGDAYTAAGQFDFSRTGTFVYLNGKAPEQGPIAWLDRIGKTETLLAEPRSYLGPRLSPDGKRLAFSVEQATVQVYDWQRNTTIQLSSEGGGFQGGDSPVWTLDGTHIVFRRLSNPGSAPKTSLLWIRADGALGPQQLLEGDGALSPYSFSPDGKRLAYSQVTQTGEKLWTVLLDATDPEHPHLGTPELFLKTERPLEPAFSPDGKWMAYTSVESRPNQIYVRPFSGPESARYPISTTGGAHPVWSRTSRELLFENPTDNRVWVVTYTIKANTFIADKPRLWPGAQLLETNSWNFDLAPDGNRLALFSRPDSATHRTGSVHVTVLLNFFDELRRRVP